jgi:WhiB family redox-sensing transcriptional regulator
MTRAWMDDAACVGRDPDMWFSNDPHDQRNARAVCDNECPVAAQCDLYRRSHSIRHGMWAGVMLKGELSELP